MNTFSDEQLKQYHQDEYILLKNLFDKEEIGLLHKSATADRTLDNKSYGRQDGEGGTVRLSLWNHPGDNIYGMFARCERMVNRAEQILDDEVIPLSLQNDPYKESHHQRYTPLTVDDNTIKKAGISRFEKDGSDAFLNPDDDHSTRSRKH